MAQAPIDLKAWDGEMASKSVDYEKLYQQMLQVSKEPASAENVEIWWRLAWVTYQSGLNFVNDDLIQAKTQEAFQYAEKAVSLDANNFQANLWQAITSGKLALIASGTEARAKCGMGMQVHRAFLRSLTVCAKQNPQDAMVLFMEGRLQLALTGLNEEEKAAIGLYLPELNWETAEAKLRESIERNPTFIDGYITLTYLLVKCKKTAEARAIIEKGLTVERVTKSDEMVAQELEKLKSRLR